MWLSRVHIFLVFRILRRTADVECIGVIQIRFTPGKWHGHSSYFRKIEIGTCLEFHIWWKQPEIILQTWTLRQKIYLISKSKGPISTCKVGTVGTSDEGYPKILGKGWKQKTNEFCFNSLCSVCPPPLLFVDVQASNFTSLFTHIFNPQALESDVI